MLTTYVRNRKLNYYLNHEQGQYCAMWNSEFNDSYTIFFFSFSQSIQMYFPHLKQLSDHFNCSVCVSYVMHITATKKKQKEESAPQRSRLRPTRGRFKSTYRTTTYCWASMTYAPIQNHQLGHVNSGTHSGFQCVCLRRAITTCGLTSFIYTTSTSRRRAGRWGPTEAPRRENDVLVQMLAPCSMSSRLSINFSVLGWQAAGVAFERRTQSWHCWRVTRGKIWAASLYTCFILYPLQDWQKK